MKEKMFKVTNFKRLFSAILVAVMVLTMIPVDTAVAEEGTYGKPVTVSDNTVSSNTATVNLVPAKVKFNVKNVFEKTVADKAVAFKLVGKDKAELKAMKKTASVSKKGILKGKKTGIVVVGAFDSKSKKAAPIATVAISVVKLQFPKAKDCVKFIGGEVFSVSDNVLGQSVSSNKIDGKDANVTLSQNSLLKALVDTDDFSITYKENSKSKVATIDKDGIVTINKDGKSGSVKVTMMITNKETNKTVKFTSKIKVKLPKLSKKKVTARIGKKNKTIKVKNIVDEKAQVVAWSSSDETVATVNNGEITAVKAGTAKITATINGCAYNCNVTVK